MKKATQKSSKKTSSNSSTNSNDLSANYSLFYHKSINGYPSTQIIQKFQENVKQRKIKDIFFIDVSEKENKIDEINEKIQICVKEYNKMMDGRERKCTTLDIFELHKTKTVATQNQPGRDGKLKSKSSESRFDDKVSSKLTKTDKYTN